MLERLSQAGARITHQPDQQTNSLAAKPPRRQREQITRLKLFICGWRQATRLKRHTLAQVVSWMEKSALLMLLRPGGLPTHKQWAQLDCNNSTELSKR